MTERETAEHRRELMDRHARIAVLIDRLESIWTLCTFEELNADYHPADEEWGKELTSELRWLHELYGEALANDGDVRPMLQPPPTAPPPVADRKPLSLVNSKPPSKE